MAWLTWREVGGSRWLHRLFLVLALLVAIAQSGFYFPRTVDDLFISLRYAQHLATGQGCVYNPGEHVEGFSSPLWLLLQAGTIAAGLDGVTGTKLLSLLSLVAFGWCAERFPRVIFGTGRLCASLGVLSLAANSYVMAWGWLGLETPLYLCLLLAFPLALHWYQDHGALRALVTGVLLGVALGAVRPEAPLFVGLLSASAFAATWRAAGDGGGARRRTAFAASLVAVCLTLLALARFMYFDRWLPHTFDAKQGGGLELGNLASLVTAGAHWSERLLLLSATGASCVLARRGRTEPLAILLGTTMFVALVAADWMPNQRHLLPVWAFGTLAVLAVASRALVVAERGTRWQCLSLALLVLLVRTGLYQARVDSRFAPRDFTTHGHGRTWVRFKTRAAWVDAWDALRRRPPSHVAAMPVSRMGMITQLFRILETAPGDEANEWYVGRDIGRVGYLSPVRVFDTDGLFTPAVPRLLPSPSQDTVSPELLEIAWTHHPLAGEIYENWSSALGRAPALLDNYDVVVGSRRRPVAFVRRGQRPSARLVAARYERVSAQLPQWFFVATLYGECVGAAVERRRNHALHTEGPDP